MSLRTPIIFPFVTGLYSHRAGPDRPEQIPSGRNPRRMNTYGKRDAKSFRMHSCNKSIKTQDLNSRRMNTYKNEGRGSIICSPRKGRTDLGNPNLARIALAVRHFSWGRFGGRRCRCRFSLPVQALLAAHSLSSRTRSRGKQVRGPEPLPLRSARVQWETTQAAPSRILGCA